MASSFPTPPANVFGAGYAFDGTYLKFPLADLPALTAGAANSTSGDSRAILFALIDAAYGNTSALVAAGNGSDRYTISKSTTAPNNAGVFSANYNIAIQLSVGTVSVPAE